MDIIIVILVLLAIFGVVLYFVCRNYRKQLKKEFKRAQKSDQLKTLFLTNVSHSLRTPLNAILKYSRLILDEQDNSMSPTQVKEMAGHIKNDSEQLLDYVSRLLELSNFEGSNSPFTHIEVNLAELIASYRRETLPIMKPEVQIRVKTDLSPHCKVTLDANGMHLLMMHLLTDAAHFSTQGDITIAYTRERGGLKVSITYMGNGQAELISDDIYSFLQKEDALMLVKDNSLLRHSICKAIIDFLDGEFDLDIGNGTKTVASFWFPCHMRDCYRKNKL